MRIKEQSVQGVILNDLSLLYDRVPLHPNVSHYFSIHGALTGKDWNIVRIRRREDHTAAGASCPIQKNAAADVSCILRSGITGQECIPGYICLIIGNSLSPETGVLIHIGVSCGDGINLQMLQHYEQGVRDLSGAKLATLLKLCRALQCSLEDILPDGETTELLRLYTAEQAG